MDVRTLEPGFAVSPQIALEDIERLAVRGFTTIINNRPDGEEPHQPSSAQVEAEARRAGLEYRYLPVASPDEAEMRLGAFKSALAQARSGTLAYCRTGTRSALLWVMSAASRIGTEAALEAARQAGYDFSARADHIRRREQS